MNTASSEDFIVEHETKDKSEGKDVGTSSLAASQACAAKISRRLGRKVACTTV